LEKLQKHFDDMQNATMQEMFQVDVTRTAKFHLKWNDFLIDYSKNIINQETMDLLLELANELGLKKAISDYFEIINQTENRAVLHTALREKRISSCICKWKKI
jgi:glucose-6-phosphate isomerase